MTLPPACTRGQQSAAPVPRISVRSPADFLEVDRVAGDRREAALAVFRIAESMRRAVAPLEEPMSAPLPVAMQLDLVALHQRGAARGPQAVVGGQRHVAAGADDLAEVSGCCRCRRCR